MKRHYTDEELIEGLRQRKKSCIVYLYEEFYPVVRHYLRQNSGNLQDVEDLFQDTILVLYKRCMEDPFVLKCSLKTYFMSVCKNLWLQRLERKCKLLYQADCEVNEASHHYSMEENDILEEQAAMQRLFLRNLEQLPAECRNLLQLYCLKIPYKEIAKLMNYKDDVYVKTRKYSCKKLLRNRIMNDPEYFKLVGYEQAGDNRRLG